MTNKDDSDSTMPTPPTATPAAASGCPVLARGGAAADPSTPAKPGLWSRWFSRSDTSGASNSINYTVPSSMDTSSSSSISECPVKGISSSSATPASIEEAAKHSQKPAPGQRIPLSTQRVISSIPRGDNDNDSNNNAPVSSEDKNKPSVPAHQPANAHHWQYPSEQQFYNAMLKKGYNPPAESIPSVLRIHNAVNERSWLQVRKWEKKLHNNDDPKLVKFVGRPKDLSPKAWLNSRVFMTQEPFDRHDWYVEDNEGGEEPRRYVIDFYEGKEKTGDLTAQGDAKKNNMPMMKPPSMYIDVRPALDNPSAAVDRMTMFVREALPGIASVYDSYRASSTAAKSNVAAMEGSNKSKEGSGNQ